MLDGVDWSYRRDYIVQKHGVTEDEADEAMADPDRVVLDPDPATTSGRGIRIIGYSITAQAVLTVIVVEEDGVTYGSNAWKANPKDQRRYNGTEES